MYPNEDIQNEEINQAQVITVFRTSFRCQPPWLTPEKEEKSANPNRVNFYHSPALFQRMLPPLNFSDIQLSNKSCSRPVFSITQTSKMSDVPARHYNSSSRGRLLIQTLANNFWFFFLATSTLTRLLYERQGRRLWKAGQFINTVFISL